MSLMVAVFLQPPPPCEVYRCPQLQRCAAERLACQSFSLYVRTGRALDPRSMLQLQAGGRTKVLGLREGDPAPSAVIFRRLYARQEAAEALTDEGVA